MKYTRDMHKHMHKHMHKAMWSYRKFLALFWKTGQPLWSLMCLRPPQSEVIRAILLEDRLC